MSLNIKNALERSRTKTAGARLVLIVLADHANRQLLAWPSQKRIARLANMSTRTVRSGLRDLEKLGEIVEIRGGRGRGSTTYRIEILAPKWEVIEPFE